MTPSNIATDTVLPMPANGIFNCTTINVASGKTLRFSANALNTPVYLLATGNVTISGTIDIVGANGTATASAGAGGPGGFAGGLAGFAGQAGQDGSGPGGGRIETGTNGTSLCRAAFSRTTDNNTAIYGNSALIPLIGGSGGAGSRGNPGNYGGGGGGAVLIASNTSITISGAIDAHGGNGSYTNNSAYYAGDGSGGSIRLISPSVGGAGSLNANGGTYIGGSPGRVRIDCPDSYIFRNLIVLGTFTSGQFMQVFPSTLPALSFIEAAGQAIVEGSVASVQIDLPAGSSPARTVKLRARNFTGVVPIRVRASPETGNSTDYDTQLHRAADSLRRLDAVRA